VLTAENLTERADESPGQAANLSRQERGLHSGERAPARRHQ